MEKKGQSRSGKFTSISQREKAVINDMTVIVSILSSFTVVCIFVIF